MTPKSARVVWDMSISFLQCQLGMMIIRCQEPWTPMKTWYQWWHPMTSHDRRWSPQFSLFLQRSAGEISLPKLTDLTQLVAASLFFLLMHGRLPALTKVQKRKVKRWLTTLDDYQPSLTKIVYNGYAMVNAHSPPPTRRTATTCCDHVNPCQVQWKDGTSQALCCLGGHSQ